jgi:hypothetical protein
VRPAEVAAAQRKVNQAAGLLRKASQRLAEAQDLDVYGSRFVATKQDAAAAGELVALALSEVVVLVCPRSTPSPRPV